MTMSRLIVRSQGATIKEESVASLAIFEDKVSTVWQRNKSIVICTQIYLIYGRGRHIESCIVEERYFTIGMSHSLNQ